MDKTLLKNIARDIDSALEEVAKKYNVVIKEEGGTYYTTYATLKLTITEKSSNGQLLSKEASDYNLYAKMYNLPEGGVGKTFISGGKTYEIVGFKTRYRSFPVIGKDVVSGKLFKFSPQTVIGGYIG